MLSRKGVRAAQDGGLTMPEATDPWKRLREPFPAERIMQLPATNKRPELDYVSHADVTDRLLEVDPEWSWEWGVNDPVTGLPSKALSLEHGSEGYSLWMALKVNGAVKRDVGYADGGTPEPMKSLVSDALRRCAMRFGVALDLWQKADSGSGTGAGGGSDSGPAPASGLSMSCPQCGKPLRDRKGAKGSFVGCSGYPECKFTRNGTLAELAEDSDGDVDPNWMDEQSFSAPPGTAPPTADKLTAQVIELAKLAGPEATLKAFKAVDAMDCLSMSTSGQYRMRKSELDKLPQDVKLEIERLLEIPF